MMGPICAKWIVDLLVAEQMKVLGVILDIVDWCSRNTVAVAILCNCHSDAILHIGHLLTRELAQMLACGALSQELTSATLCHVLLLLAPRRSFAKPPLHRLHWLSVEQWIIYKMAVIMFKVRQTASPAYLSRHIWKLLTYFDACIYWMYSHRSLPVLLMISCIIMPSPSIGVLSIVLCLLVCADMSTCTETSLICRRSIM